MDVIKVGIGGIAAVALVYVLLNYSRNAFLLAGQAGVSYGSITKTFQTGPGKG